MARPQDKNKAAGQAGRVAGDPLGETRALVAIQNAIGEPGSGGGLSQVQRVSRGMSHFGEHALGWFATSAVGAAADKKRRAEWLGVGVSAFIAHAASVIIKRIVRRPRPHDPAIRIGVGTPSRLSFPSSHATSSTAALVSIADLSGKKAPLAGVPAMGFSRLVLGVHYPTDVIAGTLIGLTTSKAVTKTIVPRLRKRLGGRDA